MPESCPYEDLYLAHRWQVPPDFNIPQACVRRWADGSGRIALRIDAGQGPVRLVSFDELQRSADAFSAGLRKLGVIAGQRVAYVLPQGVEAVVAQTAILQLGAVAMPLSTLFGPEALQHRLRNSDTRVAVCGPQQLDSLREVARGCRLLSTLVTTGTARGGHGPAEVSFEELLRTDAERFEPAPLGPDDPAYLIYTSGTTGSPKGALIPHRALLGNLPGFVLSQNDFPQPGDVFWSPADWAWTGGLMDALLPSLYFGHSIVGSPSRFDPLAAFSLMERHGVTNTFLFPTALKMMMKAVSAPRDAYRLRLRGVMSAGEPLGTSTFEWCRDALGTRVNEMFGQTEINYVVGNSAAWPAKPGSIGRPYPGHRVAVLDEQGRPCAPGQVGEVAVHRLDVHGDPDPVFFIGYWNNDAATRAKFVGEAGTWCLTGDLASVDDDGYYWYHGRADDMFKAAGYRIGPGEIENCLLKHPAVANVAVVPSPDPERGNVVKAFVVLVPGHEGTDALVKDLQLHVRGQLAPYEYPKEIEFLPELPMTTTGKVQRRVLRLREAERKKSATAT